MTATELSPIARKPEWLKVRFPGGERYQRLQQLMREQGLHTVCEEARCPNVGECWNAGTATFMILGDVCTRSCGFCNVKTGRPGTLDRLEPFRLAKAVAALELEYVVITSVNRDDLETGGAEIFASCINAIRRHDPEIRIEVLIPDFKGNREALRSVVEAKPFILNHNIETVPRLYRRVRPQAVYERSLELIQRVKEMAPGMLTKSGFMVGLGETLDETFTVMRDLRAYGCDIVTVGQYLQPSKNHLPVERFWHPDEFQAFRDYGSELGFRHVEAGPLIRSSYHAEKQSASPSVGLAVGGGGAASTDIIQLEQVDRD
jgi:lipoic acid synthetase